MDWKSSIGMPKANHLDVDWHHNESPLCGRSAVAAGNIDVFASDATDLVVDINGYFAPPGAGGLVLYNLTPCRVLDTRQPPGSLPFSGQIDIAPIVNQTGLDGLYDFTLKLAPPALPLQSP